MSGKVRIATIIGSAGVIMLLLVSIVTSKEGSVAYTKEQIERGKMLVTLGGCHDCHSPKVMSAMGPMPDTTRLLSGHPASEKLAPVPAGLLSETGWMAACNGHLSAWAGPWGISWG